MPSLLYCQLAKKWTTKAYYFYTQNLYIIDFNFGKPSPAMRFV